MATKKKITKSFEDDVLDLMDEFHKIQATRKKTWATLQKEIKSASLKTATNVPDLKSRVLELDVKKFEKFLEVILLVRNVGTKGGYQKRHLISEVLSYIDNKREYEELKNPALFFKRINK